MISKIGSKSSLQALRYGERMARAHGAVLIPVLAWELPGGDYGERVHPSGELRQVWQSLACRRLRDALIAVWGKVPDDPLLQPRVERGPPGWVLVNLACRPGDVLVVGGAARRAGPDGLSNVGRYCLAHARCPVLAIPPPALARELAHSGLAWMFWHRPLTPEQILRDQPKPAA